MFDFEKLEVYKKAKDLNKSIAEFLSNSDCDKTTHDQLRRASFSIMLNIAEGSGRFTKPDKKNFYIIARGSVFECVAIFDYLKDLNKINSNEYEVFYKKFEEISKILFALIKGLAK
ncbi:MAG: four helix bundle protein [Crocinitomicaceae bacterium]|nr:four helix bundle protein [Crocinitomicaceae bacterium]